jgi:hypothetical protein
VNQVGALPTEAPVWRMAPAPMAPTSLTPASMAPVCMPVVEKLVFRFDESENARKEAAPSVSFEYPSLREEAKSFESNEPVFIPAISIDGPNQTVTLTVSAFFFRTICLHHNAQPSSCILSILIRYASCITFQLPSLFNMMPHCLSSTSLEA